MQETVNEEKRGGMKERRRLEGGKGRISGYRKSKKRLNKGRIKKI